MSRLKVKITMIEEVLGSSPNQEDIYREYIASKAEDAATIEDEVAAIGVEAVESKGITVFPRNADKQPCIYDYQIRGFFKAAFSALAKAGKAGYEGGKHCAGMKAFKKGVDQHLFVFPRMIPYQLNGEMGYCVRPLRSDGPTGSRVALAKSETVPAGSWFECEILMLDKGLKPLVKEALEYGSLNGLGQWRNSGKGQFTYEILSEED